MTLQITRRVNNVFVALTFLTIFPVLISQAYSGVLDPTFGTKGKLTTDFPFSSSSTFYSSEGFRVFVQPSGRIVGMGRYSHPGPDGSAPGVVMVGLTQAGAIDTTYSGGKTRDWNSIAFTGLHDALMLPDGRTLRLSQYSPVGGMWVLKLKRTNIDGAIDESFAPDLSINGDLAYPGNIALRSDGKILVTVVTGSERVYLIRLNADGTRDATFGNGGEKELVRFRILPNHFSIAMRLLSDGKILIAGTRGPNFDSVTHDEFYVMRLDPNGDVDHSFGRLGLVRHSFGGQKVSLKNLLVQPDGRCIIVGAVKNPDADTLMVRFTLRGKLDTTFGMEGVAITDFTPGGDDFGVGATLLDSGKIIIAGQAIIAPSTFSSFLIARYSAGGNLEASTSTSFTPSWNSGASDVIIQPDGKILVIGYTRNPNATINGNVFAFARYSDITNDSKGRIPKQNELNKRR